MENYLLFGYSRAPKYNYIPPSFKKLNTQLGNIKAEGHRRAHFKLSYKKRDLAQQMRARALRLRNQWNLI